MRRILTAGPPGSGKTTLARWLSQVLDIPAYHLDGLYWDAGWMPKSMVEKRELFRPVLAQDSWIIDGSYAETMEMRLQAADTSDPAGTASGGMCGPGDSAQAAQGNTGRSAPRLPRQAGP